MKHISMTQTPVIPDDDVPKLTSADFTRARFQVGGSPASRADRQMAVRTRGGKRRINIMLDVPIVDHFKAQGRRLIPHSGIRQSRTAPTLPYDSSEC
jgi:uncharacterized protein (DUF4415 family)